MGENANGNTLLNETGANSTVPPNPRSNYIQLNGWRRMEIDEKCQSTAYSDLPMFTRLAPRVWGLEGRGVKPFR